MNSELEYQSKQPGDNELRRIITIVYALQAAGFFTGGLTMVAAVILNYIKREDMEGTMFASHCRWQIRTFWFGLLWSVLVAPSVAIGIGIVLLTAISIWVIYRIIKGWVRLSENKEMYPQTSSGDDKAQSE